MDQSILFLDGAGPGNQSCFSLQIINDLIVELNESFYVVLTSSDSAVTVADINRTEVTIIDDDSEF